MSAGPTTGRRRGLALALVVHVVARGIGLAVLALMASTAGQDPVSRLSVWDGGWYLRIARDGYAEGLDVADPDTGSLAFYPVYPLLLRTLASATGLEPTTVGVLLSELAAAVAAAGLYVLAARLWSPGVGVALVLFWSAQPLAVVLSMLYTEALFTALAVWAFVALQRERWLLAGVLALVAGLTRSSGLALGIAVAAYAGWWLWRGRSWSWRPVSAGVLALAGTPLWWAWVGWRTSQVDGWFAVQDQIWMTRWDWGRSTVELGLDVFSQAVRYGEATFVMVTAFLLLVLAVVLLAEAAARQVWWPLLVYAVVLLALTIGTAGFVNAKPRFLVPVFPLLIPLALALAGAGRRVQVLVGALVIGASAWFGAHLLVVWPYSI